MAVAAGTLLSRVTGLLRVVVLAAAIGKASLADTYNLANITPNIVYELLVGGVLAATLVPVFVDLLERTRRPLDVGGLHGDDDRAHALHRVRRCCSSPLIARLFVLHEHGPDRAAQLHVLTILILCFVPQMVFYGFTTLASALLNARHRFVAAAFAPVLNNVVVIVVLLVFVARTSDRHGAITDVARVRNDLGLLLLLGIGTTAGIVAMALVLVPAVAARRRPICGSSSRGATRRSARSCGCRGGPRATSSPTSSRSSSCSSSPTTRPATSPRTCTRSRSTSSRTACSRCRS